jgi:hypothetical protein
MQALKFLPSIRLGRYKFKPRLRVIFDDKFYGILTKIAYTVKNLLGNDNKGHPSELVPD